MMILEKVPTSLRGALSRWLVEPHPGVFVGNPSGRVREELWDRAIKAAKGGAVTQIWTATCSQGFTARQVNPRRRRFKDFEGLNLVQVVQLGPFTDTTEG